MKSSARCGGGARGGTRRARAEIETGNERGLTAIVSQESTLALLKAAAGLDEREGKGTTRNANS